VFLREVSFPEFHLGSKLKLTRIATKNLQALPHVSLIRVNNDIFKAVFQPLAHVAIETIVVLLHENFGIFFKHPQMFLNL